MIMEKLEGLLRSRGYQALGTGIRNVMLYRRQTEEQGWLVTIIRTGEAVISAEVYQKLLMAGSNSLYHGGCRDVQQLTLFVGDHDMQVRELAGASEAAYWLLEEDTGRLVVYEDQPAEFDQLYRPVENLLYQKRIPWWKKIQPATSILVGVNILIFVVMFLSNPAMDLEHMMNWGAMHVVSVIRDHEYYRLFTSMFLHFDLSHIFNNMLLLYFAGEQLEKQLGSVRFLLLYLLSGLCGNLLSFYNGVRTLSMAVSAGASGAVYGVIGGLFVIVLLHKGRIRNMTGRRLALLLIGSLYYGFAESGIDNMAHIGGAVGGMILSLLLFYLPGRNKHRNLQEE